MGWEKAMPIEDQLMGKIVRERELEFPAYLGLVHNHFLGTATKQNCLCNFWRRISPNKINLM